MMSRNVFTSASFIAGVSRLSQSGRAVRASALLALAASPLMITLTARAEESAAPAPAPGPAPTVETAPTAAPDERVISLKDLEDKIRGGWAGQMIGVALGTPTEFRWLGKIIEDELPWTPDFVKYALKQDDLYVDMTFAEVMDKHGLDATTEQYGEMFRDSKYHLWHANAAARRALLNGLKAPATGDPRNNIHANDIDFQIEADFIGLMTPGLPNETIKYCDRVGRVMNYGDGLYGGMFVCGAYSAAFFEKDPRKIVEAGLACMPAESGYAKIIRDALDLHAKYPQDWRAAWRELNEKWDKGDDCTTGALHPFNIDARLNGSYIALGLLYGEGDFTKTVEITTRLGQDSDCNPSNSAGIIGAALGYAAIPDSWKSGIPPLADEKFIFTSYSLNTISESTLKRAIKVIEMTGGRVEGDNVIVKTQTPTPPALEQWEMGDPREILPSYHESFTYTDGWQKLLGQQHKFMGIGTNVPGQEMTLKFKGVAVALTGPLRADGGMVEIHLDGKKIADVNLWLDENTHDNSLWHTYGLEPGEHTLKLVVSQAKDPRSTNRVVIIESAIVYE